MPKAPTAQLIFHGTLIHSEGLDELGIIENAVIAVDTEGRIIALEKNVPRGEVPAVLRALEINAHNAEIRRLDRTEFLIPGFVDTHNHAPQYAQVSLQQTATDIQRQAANRYITAGQSEAWVRVCTSWTGSPK